MRRRWTLAGSLIFLTTAVLSLGAADGAAAATVTVTLTGTGTGTVKSTPAGIECSNTPGHEKLGAANCIHSFGLAQSVKLKATPDGSPALFQGWTGTNAGTCASGTANPCSFTSLVAPVTVSAAFRAPPELPIVVTEGTGAGSASYFRTLHGQVNPNGEIVEGCRFEYGATAALGSTTPCLPKAGELGGGTSPVAVSAMTEPLEPGTTYFYRLAATNPGGTAQGAVKTFTSGPTAPDGCPNAARRLEQGIAATLLPDCMALEMASPAEKSSQPATLDPKGNSSISADGQRLLFRTGALVPGSPGSLGLGGDLYVATRGASGWSSATTSPPHGSEMVRGWEPLAEARSFTPDLSRWLQVAATEAQYQVGKGRAFEGSLDGSFTPLSPLFEPLLEPIGRGLSETLEKMAFQGASADHSHLFFTPGRSIFLPDRLQIAYLPGDPTLSGIGSVLNTYVAHPDESDAPSLELLARDRNGKVWGGSCGTVLGGKPTGLFAHNQGAISEDGKRTYFSTRPGQAASGECDSTNKLRVMERLESSQGTHIEELFSPECYRANCSTANGDDFYQGASQDGTKVFFATNRQLTTSDTDTGAACSATIGSSGGCDLYLYDSSLSAGHRLIQVSEGEAGSPTPGEGAEVLNGTVGISADGSHVYFVATGVLTTANGPGGSPPAAGQPNLYLYERDEAHPNGHIAFVGQLNGGDTPGLWGGEATWRNQAYPVPILDHGGDGHVLLFQTKAALGANDTDGTRVDGYRYDAGDETLACITCRPGGPDGEPFDVVAKFVEKAPGTDFAEQGRWSSEDGEAVVFKTAEPLVPGDVNGVTDSYLWREGSFYRLPGTADPAGKLNDEPILSTEGTTVAFQTFAPLLPEDIDDATDVYVARVDGGFPSKAATQTCDPSSASACQGAAPTSPPAPNSASTNSTAGNPPPKSTACLKGSRKVRSKGKTRCIKPHRKKQRTQRQHRREANANRRAGK